MNGMSLSRAFWEEVGKLEFERRCPEALEHCAVGLAGEGSECFGFDDEISRDHDWGPEFCVWLPQSETEKCGEALAGAYASLPDSFMGYPRRMSEMTAYRRGVQTTETFLLRHIGLDRPPRTLQEWRMVPENGLAVVTNGEIFADAGGEFSALRRELLRFYPEDVRKKKLARCCALAAQSGQYNYYRCLKRGETAAAFLALSIFTENVQSAVFLLNGRYKPYYKWAQRALRALPLAGKETAALLDQIASGGDRTAAVEETSALVISLLRAQGLTDADSDFLFPHAESIMRGIGDDALRGTDMLSY